MSSMEHPTRRRLCLSITVKNGLPSLFLDIVLLDMASKTIGRAFLTKSIASLFVMPLPLCLSVACFVLANTTGMPPTTVFDPGINFMSSLPGAFILHINIYNNGKKETATAFRSHSWKPRPTNLPKMF